MIKNLFFDFGGVFLELDMPRGVKAFEKMGFKEASTYLNAYRQVGFFLQVEDGSIDAEEYLRQMSEHCGRKIGFDEVQQCWMDFISGIPQYKLDFAKRMQEKYSVFMVSNINPFIMRWAFSPAFGEEGKSVDHYFQKLFLSYQMKQVKPDAAFFEQVLKDTGVDPTESLFIDDGAANVAKAQEFGFQTYHPANKEDWRQPIEAILNANKIK
ncbi:MAG: HAD family phosphatase [Massilibacteroides sp.]|nr:HAD family phosphatase [Massilibacteroides sp.]